MTGERVTVQRYGGGWSVEVSWPGDKGREWLGTSASAWTFTRRGALRLARRVVRDHARTSVDVTGEVLR